MNEGRLLQYKPVERRHQEKPWNKSNEHMKSELTLLSISRKEEKDEEERDGQGK
jgi:hypothetical protein